MSLTTIQSHLVADEETRRYLWHLMAEKNTPLVNELLDLVSRHEDFEAWRRKGLLPGNAVKLLCEPLRQKPPFEGQPGRFYSSTIRIVQQTYEAWLALHRTKQAALDGKKRWLQIVESDTQLAAACAFTPEVICAKAREILEQISAASLSSHPIAVKPKKSRKSQKAAVSASTISSLFELFHTTDDILSRRAIIHLLKHGCQVKEEEEDLEKWVQRLARKRIEIQRLEQQLKARHPRGRATTEQDAERQRLKAICLPEHPGLMYAINLTWALLCDPTLSAKYTHFVFTFLLKRVCQFEEARIHFEFFDWAEDFAVNRLELVRSPKSLPYPILYGSEDLIRWHRNDKGRICLSFNGLGKYTFEVYCDRRQLPLFELFLEDGQTLTAKENKKQYSGSKLLLREASLLWIEPSKVVSKKKLFRIKRTRIKAQLSGAVSPQTCEEDSAPWNRYRLALHCTFNAHALTQEGTERICQEKLTKRDKLLEKLSQQRESDLEQTQTLNREQVKQKRLESAKDFRRSDRALYRGDADVLVGVSFNLADPATVAIVRGSTGETLAYRSLRQLLGQNYKLLNRQQQQQWQHDKQRRKNQQRGLSTQLSESELGQYVDRLIAKAVIALAKQFKAGSVVLPNLKGLRERIQSELAAKAEQKHPGNRALQTSYAKDYRRQVHRWSYQRLAQNIQAQAAKANITIEIGQQPLQGSSQEKARTLALSTYHARQLSQA